MTVEDATVLMAKLLAGFPNAQPPEASLDAYYDHLEPLPLDRAEAGVDRLIAGVDRDPKAAPHFPRVPEVLDAIGIHGQARLDLLHIKGDTTRKQPARGHLFPSLRSVSGWEIVPAGGPASDGVAIACREAGRPLPAGATVALPPAPAPSPEPRRLAPTPIAAASGTPRRAPGGPDRRAVTDLAIADVPAPLRPIVERMTIAAGRLEKAADVRDSEALALRELRAEIQDELAQDAAPLECAKPAAARLLARIAATDLEGRYAAVLVLVEALYPDLKVATFDEKRGPNTDPFEDEPGPIESVRVLLKRNA